MIVSRSKPPPVQRRITLSRPSGNPHPPPRTDTVITLCINNKGIRNGEIAKMGGVEAENIGSIEAVGNLMTRVPRDLEIMGGLKYLDLAYNFIREFRAVKLPNLIRLNISHNCLSTLPSFTTLPSLRTLLVTHNSLTTIPSLPPTIRVLHLSTNPIHTLPVSLFTPSPLRELRLDWPLYLSTLPTDSILCETVLAHLPHQSCLTFQSVSRDIERNYPMKSSLTPMEFIAMFTPLDRLEGQLMNAVDCRHEGVAMGIIERMEWSKVSGVVERACKSRSLTLLSSLPYPPNHIPLITLPSPTADSTPNSTLLHFAALTLSLPLISTLSPSNGNIIDADGNTPLHSLFTVKDERSYYQYPSFPLFPAADQIVWSRSMLTGEIVEPTIVKKWAGESEDGRDGFLDRVVECFTALVKAGVDPNRPNDAGYCPGHMVILVEDFQLFMKIREKEVPETKSIDWKLAAKGGEEPILHMAAKAKDWRFFPQLLEHSGRISSVQFDENLLPPLDLLEIRQSCPSFCIKLCKKKLKQDYSSFLRVFNALQNHPSAKSSARSLAIRPAGSSHRLLNHEFNKSTRQQSPKSTQMIPSTVIPQSLHRLQKSTSADKNINAQESIKEVLERKIILQKRVKTEVSQVRAIDRNDRSNDRHGGVVPQKRNDSTDMSKSDSNSKLEPSLANRIYETPALFRKSILTLKRNLSQKSVDYLPPYVGPEDMRSEYSGSLPLENSPGQVNRPETSVKNTEEDHPLIRAELNMQSTASPKSPQKGNQQYSSLWFTNILTNLKRVSSSSGFTRPGHIPIKPSPRLAPDLKPSDSSAPKLTHNGMITRMTYRENSVSSENNENVRNHFHRGSVQYELPHSTGEKAFPPNKVLTSPTQKKQIERVAVESTPHLQKSIMAFLVENPPSGGNSAAKNKNEFRRLGDISECTALRFTKIVTRLLLKEMIQFRYESRQFSKICASLKEAVQTRSEDAVVKIIDSLCAPSQVPFGLNGAHKAISVMNNLERFFNRVNQILLSIHKVMEVQALDKVVQKIEEELQHDNCLKNVRDVIHALEQVFLIANKHPATKQKTYFIELSLTQLIKSLGHFFTTKPATLLHKSRQSSISKPTTTHVKRIDAQKLNPPVNSRVNSIVSQIYQNRLDSLNKISDTSGMGQEQSSVDEKTRRIGRFAFYPEQLKQEKYHRKYGQKNQGIMGTSGNGAGNLSKAQVSNANISDQDKASSSSSSSRSSIGCKVFTEEKNEGPPTLKTASPLLKADLMLQFKPKAQSYFQKGETTDIATSKRLSMSRKLPLAITKVLPSRERHDPIPQYSSSAQQRQVNKIIENNREDYNRLENIIKSLRNPKQA